MMRYLPIVAGVALIVGLTFVQIGMTDRFSGTNVTAEQQAVLLKNVPMNIGDWRGTDLDVDEATRKTAGAIGAISRRYRNMRTGEEVDLWLIVGHAREVASHLPNTCYKASGFEQRAPENALYTMVVPGLPEAPFWTNTFLQEDIRGRRLRRVFWSWFNPSNEENDGKVVWEAPTNARRHFGNTRALYKMYFTSEMRDQVETTDESECIAFAKVFMPKVEAALTQMYSENLGEPLTGSSAPSIVADTEAPAETEVASTIEELEDGLDELNAKGTPDSLGGEEQPTKVAP